MNRFRCIRELCLVLAVLQTLIQNHPCNGQRVVTSLGVKSNKHDKNDQSNLSKVENGSRHGDSRGVSSGTMGFLDLGFSDIYMEITTKKKSQQVKRVLLDGSIKGRAQPGRMLAIMGPSGAGKSTLLHALSGRLKENSQVCLEGNRYVTGKRLNGSSMLPCAFVEQETSFFAHMTVRETLCFRAELKLGRTISMEAKDELVSTLIEDMRLEKAADTIVGNARVRGISGGERRRLAIACELVTSPAAIFLDEPTSGLDSTSATSLIQSLRNLANKGKTIIAVIHQPSQHIFASFDDLLLLSEGKQMYFGEVDRVRQYMDGHARMAADGMGTAEHIIGCISSVSLNDESEAEAAQRIESLVTLAQSTELDIGPTTEMAVALQPEDKQQVGANFFTQVKLLLQRAVRENLRSKAKLIIQTVQQVTLGLIYGGIYSIGLNQASIQDRFGLLSLIAIGSANMALASTVRSFPKEKAIVSAELASKMYDTMPYFIGKAASEIPLIVFFNSLFGVLVSGFTGLNKSVGKIRRFLGLNVMHGLASQSVGLMIGAVSPNSDTALALFPAIMVLNIIFDGKNISEENTPRLLRWIPKVGLIRWGFEGLCLNEFEGLEFETKGPYRGAVVKDGAEALARLGLGARKIGVVVRAQALITFSCWSLSYLGLKLTRQKFEVMNAPMMQHD